MRINLHSRITHLNGSRLLLNRYGLRMSTAYRKRKKERTTTLPHMWIIRILTISATVLPMRFRDLTRSNPQVTTILFRPNKNFPSISLQKNLPRQTRRSISERVRSGLQNLLIRRSRNLVLHKRAIMLSISR